MHEECAWRHLAPDYGRPANDYRPVPRRDICHFSGCCLGKFHDGPHEGSDGYKFAEGAEAQPVKPGDPIPPGWVHQPVFVDPAFDNADKSVAGVMFRFPEELIGPDSPDAGAILKEVQAVAELLS